MPETTQDLLNKLRALRPVYRALYDDIHKLCASTQKHRQKGEPISAEMYDIPLAEKSRDFFRCLSCL